MTLRDRAAAHNGSQGSSEVATTNAAEIAQPRQSIVGFVQGLKPLLAEALPRHLTADRMARLALTEIRKTPKLAACTPESFAGAILTAAALGLEVGGHAGEAYLVPYEHRKGALAGQIECQLQVGYQGYTKLFYQHPLAADIDAQAVYEHDDFDYAYGTDKYLRHRPATGNRGRVIYYYAVAQLTTGASHFVVLTPDEVRTLRGGKVGPSGQIDDPQLWMERKTAIRQCLKVLPKSTQLSQAIAAEDTAGAELYRVQVETNAPAEQVAQRALTAAAETEAEPEPVDDQDAPPPDDYEGWQTRKPTQAMKNKIHAALGELNITERDGKLRYYADVVGRKVGSTNDLTFDEASQVIDALEHDLEAAQEASQ